MRWDSFSKFLGATLTIVLVFAFSISPLALSIKQGLDLQGGTHIVLEAVDTPEAKVDDDAVQRVTKIIERRVNELGLTEPIIQRQGERRVIVELPGIKDPEKAIEMLKSVTTSSAVVKRDGQVQKFDAKELTIGDIVILEEGDTIPADLVLIETNRLKVDESNLTGESVPVEKSPKEELIIDI